MESFPAMVPLAGAWVAVAGEGPAAQAKARLFDGSPARLLRVPCRRATSPDAYRSARLAFVAVSDADAAAAAAAARSAGALVNVVDRPELCDFTTPALVDRGAVLGAIATGGRAPALAADLRQALEAAWAPGLGRVAELVDAVKAEARAAAPQAPARRVLLRALVRGPAAAAAEAGDMAGALVLARAVLAGAPARPKLVLAALPAAPDLISLRLLRRLSEADRVVADAEVDPKLLAYVRRDAEVELLRPGQAWRAPVGGRDLVVVRLAADPAALDDAPEGVEVERLA